jgi:hypothetical protein
MKLFSYAMVYALIVFLIYNLIKLFRFAYVRIKAYMISRKLSKVADSEKKLETEKKDD